MKMMLDVKNYGVTFPSPYGVSFILINDAFKEAMLKAGFNVSVSLRSIIHSYRINFNKIEELVFSFRLLTEYHSFLFKDILYIYKTQYLCLLLLTEYHSFLC